MISRSVNTKTFKEICGTEKTKVELGYVNFGRYFKVDNQTLLPYPRPTLERGKFSDISKGRGSCSHSSLILYFFLQKYGNSSLILKPWEVLSSFFTLNNIEAKWHQCSTWGNYDEKLRSWTGCVGKVKYVSVDARPVVTTDQF